VPREGYRIGVPLSGYYRERINTDAAVYGGSNMGNAGGVGAEEVSSHGRPYSLCLTLPPLATVILEHRPH
jgi:1,4-alpha-glucan branching enzyme